MRRLWLLALLLTSCHREEPALSTGKPWLGVMGLGPTDRGLPVPGYRQALQIGSVVPGSPAEKAGIRAGDFIAGCPGVDFSSGSLGDLAQRLRASIQTFKPGETLRLTILRDRVERDARLDGKPLGEEEDPEALLSGKPPGPRYTLSAQRRIQALEIPVRLEALPESRPLPPDELIFPGGFPESPEERISMRLVREAGWEADVEGLQRHLAASEENPDPWRLSRMGYAHRNPWRMPQAAQRMIREMATPSLAGRIRTASAWLDRPMAEEQGLDGIEAVLKEAGTRYDQAFAKLSAADLEYLDQAVDALKIGDDPPQRMLALAGNVDFAELFQAAAVLAAFVERPLPEGLKPSVRETPWGRIVVAGDGPDWHEEEAAVLIDLGGDDFYSSRCGASGPGRPFSIVIDCDGNDSYESSRPFAQGCGRLGVGILADLAGDDRYVCTDWGQGASLFGVGVLWDGGGRDEYQGADAVQASALWGISLMVDEGGDDRYQASGYAQACGMTGGFALLEDASGNDRYDAKGRHPASHPEHPGLFNALSQGCGLGFRGCRTSGGIGLLADLKGDDRYDAGDFSQGGSYYYAWGLLYDGAGNDDYLSARYGQGYAAHETLGYFEDAGGNDRYRTRHGQVQGCSWDESVVAFLERGGDDVYEGESGFSHGASAHNSVCLFVDYGGDDVYRSREAPPRSGPNDYHGGTSLSVVLDLGGGRDRYETGKDLNDQVTRAGEHAVLGDLKGMEP